MPQFRVEALEKFVVRTVYYVEAADKAAAEAICLSPHSPGYSEKEIEEGDEEWLETVSVTEVPDAPPG